MSEKQCVCEIERVCVSCVHHILTEYEHTYTCVYIYTHIHIGGYSCIYIACVSEASVQVMLVAMPNIGSNVLLLLEPKL